MTAGTAPRKPPNPFVGPRALRQGERIYGRDHEVLQLLDLLIAERIVLLYSPSGAGKTSLIEAGLIPKLREERFGVLPVVRIGRDPGHHHSGSSGNRYLASMLLSLEGDAADGRRQGTDGAGRSSLGAYLERRAGSDGHDTQVLIIDALEELLTLDPTDGPTKERFMAELGEVLRDRKWWALFAIREDYLGGLKPYLRHVPTRLATTFRLNLLEAPAARAAMQSPARAAGVVFSDAAAGRLVDNLRSVRVQRPEGRVEELGPYVEPVQLQVVCHRLWEQLPDGATEIGTADVEAVGDVDRALADYYAEQVAAVADRAGMRERTLREWFDRELIAEQGFRGQVLQGPAGDPQGQALRLLEDAHLIRSEQRRGATWFELTHDRLVQPIRTDNAVWRARNLSPLQRQAVLWNDQHRSEGLLLRGDALADAERRLREEPVELSATERQFLDACRALAAREREAARRQRWLRRLTVSLAALLVLTLVVAGLALQQRNRAQAASARALAATRLAASRQLTAEASSVLDGDPRTALLLGIAAQRLHDDADTRAGLVGSLTATAYAGTLRHDRAVNGVAFSRDGRTVASASADGRVRLWDVARRAPAGPPLRGHRDAVTSVAFSREDRLLASGGDDGTVRLWDIRDRAGPVPLGRPMTGHRDAVTSVAFSPDGRLLASAGVDQTVRLWDVARRAPLGRPLTGHRDKVWSVAFSPDSRILASGGRDSTVRLWKVTRPARLAPLGVLRGHRDPVNAVAFSPRGRLLASASADQTVILRDLSDPAHPADLGAPLTGHSAGVFSVAFSPDGRSLATGGYDTSTILWNVADPSRPVRLRRLGGHQAAVNSVAFGRDGHTLVTGSHDATAIIWSLKVVQLARPAAELDGQQEGVAAVAFSPDGRALATAGADGSVDLWDPARRPSSRRPRAALRVSDEEVAGVAFSPDGRTMATAGEEGTVGLWAVGGPASRDPLSRFGDRQVAVTSVAFSPDGRTVASGDDDGRVIVWDVSDPAHPVQPGRLLARHDGAVNAVAFSPDGQVLASAGDDARVLLWSLTDPNHPAPLGPVPAGHAQGVVGLAFSPDGRTLATGGDDWKVVLWDLADPKRPVILGRPLLGHGAQVSSLAFSPDSRVLASAGDDQTVILWDVTDRNRPVRLGRPLVGHGEAVNSVAFSPDGRLLAAGVEIGKTILWDLTQVYAIREGAAARACSLTGGGLDSEAWSRYLPRLPFERTCPERP